MDKQIEEIKSKLEEIEEEKEILKEEQKKLKCNLYLIKGQLNYLLSKIIKYESGSDSDDICYDEYKDCNLTP